MASTGEAGRPHGRRPALDGLRTLAFTAVFLSHLPDSPFAGGGVGVLVFFVLSGYLITGLLLEERDRTGRISLGRFYLRRAARLLPAAALVVVASLVFVAVVDVGPVVRFGTVHGSFPALFYFANYLWFFNGFGWEQLGILGHFWSLSVEEQFYLVWPVVLVAVLTRRSERVLLVVLAVVCVGSPWLRTQADAPAEFFGTHLIADQLAWGAVLAVAVRLWPRAVAIVVRAFALPAVVVIFALAIPQQDSSPFGATAVAGASAVVVGFVEVSRSRVVDAMGWEPFAYVGRISYGLYLWHLMCIITAGLLLPPGLVGMGAALLAFAVAAASFHGFESRIVRVAARHTRRGITPMAPAARPSPAAGPLSSLRIEAWHVE